MKYVTILTPVYNRSKEIVKLYESLLIQTKYDFEWLIIDDGSNDDLKKVVNKFKTNKFKIKYVYKKNGGKHSALNLGFEISKSNLTIIVDSDDYLTKDAIKIIIDTWERYKKNDKLVGMVFRKGFSENHMVGKKFKEREFISNYNDYVINNNIPGDKTEVFKTEILKLYRYPEFKSEKFMGEGFLWSKISRKYDMIFVDKIIYICNYLEGGLTKSGRLLRIKCPKGGMVHAEEYLDNIYTLKIREKNALLYLTYAIFDRKKIISVIRNNNHKILLIINILPSIILYLYWRKKYYGK